MRSQLVASKVTGDTSRRIRVMGSSGAYVVGGFDGQEDALLAGRTPATEGDAWGVEAESAWGAIHRGADDRGRAERARPVGHATTPRSPRPVRGEGPVPVDPLEAVAVLEILDAALVSSASTASSSLR